MYNIRLRREIGDFFWAENFKTLGFLLKMYGWMGLSINQNLQICITEIGDFYWINFRRISNPNFLVSENLFLIWTNAEHMSFRNMGRWVNINPFEKVGKSIRELEPKVTRLPFLGFWSRTNLWLWTLHSSTQKNVHSFAYIVEF